jgi:hypothetical protein
MEKSLKTLVTFLLLLVLGSILSYFVNPTLYHEIIKEDGIIEYVTALLLLITGIFLFIKVLKSIGYRSRGWVAFNIFISIGLFFGFGEEISWGQRIFNIVPGEYFIEHNAQKETNLHNLKISGFKINKWVFSYLFSIIFGLYFFLLGFCYKKIRFIKKYVDKLGVPIPRAKHIFIFSLLSVLIFNITHEKKWELWECLFSIVLFLIFIEPYNMKEKLIRAKTDIHQ